MEDSGEEEEKGLKGYQEDEGGQVGEDGNACDEGGFGKSGARRRCFLDSTGCQVGARGVRSLHCGQVAS